VTVPATQKTIDALAERIERAYRLRRPGWHGGSTTLRVWAVAAANLLRVHENDPAYPADPELFVVAQPLDSPFADPWRELTQEVAARHYRARVREIIRALRAELQGEIRLAEGRVAAGQPIACVLAAECRRLSPLGRYIVAHRAGRPVLALRFLDGAVEQHRSCPLYLAASAGLLPPGRYPTVVEHDRADAQVCDPVATAAARHRPPSQVHLN
jgi:hypothetical protein